MATDILFDKVASEDLDFNEIFLKIGTMNPKELYLTDLTHCQDTSSSDSGISTLDDFHDVANMTDLNNVLDTDLKDFDFGLGLMSPKIEHDELFDPDSFIKAEPYSPPTFSENDILADLFLHDGMITIESSHSTAPSSHQPDLSSPEPWAYSLNHPSTTNNPSSPSSLQTQPWPSPSSQCSPPTTTYSQAYQSTNHHISNNAQDMNLNTCRKDSPQYIITPPASPSSIIVLPSIKMEKQISILPCPSSRMVSAGGGGHTPISASCNIDLILNSKVKIQPKPGSEVIIPEASPQWITTSANCPVPLSSHHQTAPIITSSSLISCVGISTVTDEKSLKRAQRIIKNRESASLSRKRKKEYMSSLEERLQQCRHENERLLRENETLRQQLQQLQSENTGLKPPHLSPAKKVCIMCFVFLLTLNLSPFSFLSGPSSVGSNTEVGPSYHTPGRHLMSLPDDSTGRTAEYGSSGAGARKEYWSSDILMQLDEELSLLAERLNITGKLGNMCPTYFNFTESNRLAEQLRGWMISQEEEKKKTEISGQKKKKDNPPMRHFGKAPYSKNKQQVPDNKVGGTTPAASENNYPVQLFSGSLDPRQHLLNAIPRRNDTFYVLSFSTDYFLVPATAHNKTMRPRMSLLMPVVTSSINGSTNQGSDSVGMMQIDCEILSTNIINVHRSAFPQEPQYNFTSHAPASPSTGFERNHESSGSSSSRNRSEESIKSKYSREERSSTGTSHDHEYWKRLNQTTV